MGTGLGGGLLSTIIIDYRENKAILFKSNSPHSLDQNARRACSAATKI
jgi:hypothetical protein